MLRNNNNDSKRSTRKFPNGDAIRTRRTYFDVHSGQLHVRTAFPATGGFDEQPPLICVHASGESSRVFGPFLPAIAALRSVYAPDLPGSGESDPPPAGATAAGAGALRDLARDLRLREVDLITVGDGAAIAADLLAVAPALVRRLVLLDPPGTERFHGIAQPLLVIGPMAAAGERVPPALAQRVAEFLDRR